jgi:DNA-binding transcriptional LysR family regulator
MRAQHPGIELSLLNRPSPVIAAAVAERAVDLGITALPLPVGLRLGLRPAAELLRIEPLLAQRDVLIAPRDHPLAAHKRVSLSTLGTVPLLLLEQGTAARATLDHALLELAVVPQVVMEMGSVEVLKRLVELGFGCSVVPAHAVAPEREQGTLAVIALSGMPARSIGLLTPTVGPLSPAARAMIELARRVLKGRLKA